MDPQHLCSSRIWLHVPVIPGWIGRDWGMFLGLAEQLAYPVSELQVHLSEKEKQKGEGKGLCERMTKGQ